MRAHAQRGAALVTVMVVLVALAVVATPFALSMRNLEATGRHHLRREQVRAGAELAVAAAVHGLQGTHPLFDVDSPHVDDRRELAVAADDDLLPDDPRGRLRSVTVADEQGKVHLPTASAALLGNLLGGRTTLSAPVDAAADSLPVVSSQGFRGAGLVVVDRELVEYSGRGPGSLDECRRGFASASLPGSRQARHRIGADVYDLRVLLAVQHGWRIRPGVFDVFRRVDGLKDTGLYGELTWSAEELEAVRPLLTVHGPAPAWTAAQRVQQVDDDRTGAARLRVEDGSRYGPGTVVRLTAGDGAREWNLVQLAVDWGDHWKLSLLEPLSGRYEPGTARVEALVRAPVNLNTAPPAVLRALLAGLGRSEVADVVTADEARQLAVALAEQGAVAGRDLPGDMARDLARALASPVQAGAYSAQDVAAATGYLRATGADVRGMPLEALAGELEGLLSWRSAQRISSAKAEVLASWLGERTLRSHEDLRGVLDTAVDRGVCSAGDREVILRCALDAGDARITGGTAPFTYGSGGVFEVRAAASDNLPSGREQARAFMREVVSVAPPGESARTYATQRDFAAVERAGPAWNGWTSWPAVTRGGTGAVPPAGPATSRQRIADERAAEPLDLRAARAALVLGEGRQAAGRPQRAGPLVAGTPGPSEDPDASYLAPAPVRDRQPGTLHFDEGLPGLVAPTPAGWNTADGPLALSVSGLDVRVAGSDGRLGTFAVEFWFELADPQSRTILFDGGNDELEDRVLLYVADGELVFRVCDTAIPDFEAVMDPGRPPPCGGEIRYGFDDGLELLAGVPYHVLAVVAGARDTAMSLFVDGVPRGRRAFTTALADDVPGAASVGAGVSSYAGSLTLPVESTAGFPSRGALRVGDEVMEYVDKQDKAFLVRAAGTDDPFGGRGRRGTLARDHQASELVELMGWTRPLASEEASRGDAALASDLGPFAVAEVDPGRALSSLNVQLNVIGVGAPETLLLGTGLSGTDSSIPLRGAGGVQLRNDTFQGSGGYAILFCDYGGSALVGQSITPAGATSPSTIPAQTDAGAWIGGAEVIRYTGYSNSTLTGVQRGQAGIPVATGGNPSDLQGGSTAAYVTGGTGSWSVPKAWVTSFDPALRGQVPGLPDEARVLVIPISVGLSSGDAFNDFHPAPNGSLGDRSPLVQLGLDFDAGDDATEWVRWDTATSVGLVRDDGVAVDAALQYLNGLALWNPDASTVDDGTVEGLNDELDFRGQAGTLVGPHTAAAPALPTLVLGGWGVAEFGPVAGIPGRHDAVTLVSGDGQDKEWHRINHATTSDPDWGGYCLVGLRDAVLGDYLRSEEGERDHYALEDLALDELFGGDGEGRRSIERLNVDSRRLTRMMAAPSGELPSVPVTSFHLGADYGGHPSEGTLIVDELRFSAPDVPGPLVPDTGRYVLADELTFAADQQLELEVSSLLFPHAVRRDPILGADALEVLSELPQAGGLLLVGEEIVGYAGLDPVRTGAVFLTGRGLYGTARAHHARGEPVLPLTAWAAAPLARSVDADDALLPLVDAASFPGAGLVWVGDELLEYTGVVDGALSMPPRPGSSRLAPDGVLRGRFGTEAAAHPAGSLVRWMPARYRDRALLEEDVPEASRAVLSTWAPGAFFTELALSASLPDERVVLSVRAVCDPELTAEPLRTATTARGGDPGRVSLGLGRQADRLDVELAVLWEAGAFDALGHGSNAWKLVPWVRSVTLGHVQPTLVLEHEEWR